MRPEQVKGCEKIAGYPRRCSLHVAEIATYGIGRIGETMNERVTVRVDSVGYAKIDTGVNEPLAGRRDFDPFERVARYVIKHASLQRSGSHAANVMQADFELETSPRKRMRHTTDFVVALKNENTFPAESGEKCRSTQPADTRADDDCIKGTIARGRIRHQVEALVRRKSLHICEGDNV